MQNPWAAALSAGRLFRSILVKQSRCNYSDSSNVGSPGEFSLVCMLACDWSREGHMTKRVDGDWLMKNGVANAHGYHALP